MKIVTIKGILWFFTIMLMVLSFPIQVYLDSPLPSLFSYIILCMIFAFTIATKSKISTSLISWTLKKPIETLITIFVILVLFQTCWQTLLQFISVGNGAGSIVIFIFPVAYYIYFRNALTEKELRYILFSMAIAGLIVGVYFSYESISKLLYGILPEYAMRAHDYSLKRGGGNIEGYKARIDLAGRSMGLLEKHAVSSAWISIGCFASLSLIPHHSTKKRAIVMGVYGILLVLGMNFTGILGFLLAVFLVEFRGYYLFRGVFSRRSFSILLTWLSVFAVIMVIISMVFGSQLMHVMRKFIEFQYNIASGNRIIRQDNLGYFGGMLSELASFPVKMWHKFPPGLLIGDGFSPGWFGKTDKGGDYGFIETLYRLGPTLFLIILLGLISLVSRSLRQLKYLEVNENDNSCFLQFSAAVIIYLLFSELHYTVWTAKSLFPVFFLCMAIFSRYLLPSKRQGSKIAVSPPASEENRLSS
jgi:hypothetical protein